MIHVGLTGGIGSGKSSVARLLAEHGAVVIDLDAISRSVLTDQADAIEAVVERFGPGVRGTDGSIDRGALGSAVFGDSASREWLERLVLTRVRTAERDRLDAERTAGTGVLVSDSPLLVEQEQAGAYDVVLVVEAPTDARVARVLERTPTWDDAKVRSVMAIQASAAQRRAVADHVIANDGDRSELQARVDDVWRSLTATR